MKWSAFFYPHTVAVADLLRSGGMGARFAPARELPGEVRDEQHLIRGADGAETVSSSRVTLALPQVVPVGSKVTLWPGTENERTSLVLAVAREENAPPLAAFLVLSLE